MLMTEDWLELATVCLDIQDGGLPCQKLFWVFFRDSSASHCIAWTSRVAGLSETALAVFQGFCSIRKALFLGVFTCHPTMLQETMMGSASQGSWLGTIKNEHRSIKH